MFSRLQKFNGLKSRTCFLWGPRQTGKSTLLQQIFPHSPCYDLLLSDEFERFIRRPSLLREELLASPPRHGIPVIIDEIQKVPALLDDVHWLIRNRAFSFILCGSSPRKLLRTGGHLLGGRALRYELFPLVYKEIPDFDLERALNFGLLPPHYLSEDPVRQIQAYVGDYLKEEIAAEALVRNIPAFARFLESAAFSNGEIVNYTNIASECGVSRPTVKAYFQIVQDTLLGRFLPVYQKKPKRRVIHAPKFYLFDLGIANHLLKRGRIVMGSELFGRSFEHFIYQELVAHSHYSGLGYPISYWRTASQMEVDFVLGSHEVAVEVKGTADVSKRHLRGLRAFQEEYRTKHSILVAPVPRPRLLDGILIFPWEHFLQELWNGNLIH